MCACPVAPYVLLALTLGFFCTSFFERVINLTDFFNGFSIFKNITGVTFSNDLFDVMIY